jgi:hypothetical protein
MKRSSCVEHVEDNGTGDGPKRGVEQGSRFYFIPRHERADLRRSQSLPEHDEAVLATKDSSPLTI